MEDITELKDKKEPKKKVGKYILYLVLIIGLTCLVLGFSLSGETVYEGVTYPTVVAIGMMFKDMDIMYIFIFIGMLLLSHSLGSFCLFMFARLYTRKYKYHQALANQMVGTFYNNITPGANSGGQFAQAITFKKQGVNISNAASVLVMQFIIYQLCLLFVGLISLFKINNVLGIGIIRIGESFEIPIVVFIILGFLLNAIVITTMFLVSYSRRLHNFVLNHGVNLLYKLHIVTDLERKRDEFRIQIENFRIELRRLQSNIPFTVLIFLLTLFVMIINDSFPYVVGLSLGAFEDPSIDIANRIFESIVFTNYHQMICGLIPIPGSAGVSEFIFTNLFQNYYDASFTTGGIKAAMLLWRMITYYFPFLISAIVAATYKSRGVKTVERFYSLERSTFVTLQLETFEERKKSSDEQYLTKSLERKELLAKLKIGKHHKTEEIVNKEDIKKEEEDENRNFH